MREVETWISYFFPTISLVTETGWREAETWISYTPPSELPSLDGTQWGTCSGNSGAFNPKKTICGRSKDTYLSSRAKFFHQSATSIAALVHTLLQLPSLRATIPQSHPNFLTSHRKLTIALYRSHKQTPTARRASAREEIETALL